MDITRWSTLKSDWLYSLQPRWRSSIQSGKTRLGADCGSDHELLIAKFRVTLKKVRKTPRPFSSVQFSHSVVSNSMQLHEPYHARPPCPWPTLGVHPNPCPLAQWCIQSSHPLSFPPPPALNLSQPQGLFKWVSSSHQVAELLEFQPQYQSFQRIFRTDLL